MDEECGFGRLLEKQMECQPRKGYQLADPMSRCMEDVQKQAKASRGRG